MPPIDLPDDLFSTREPAKIRLADMGIRTTDATGNIPADITLIHRRIASQIPGEKMDAGQERTGASYSFQEAIRHAQKMKATHMLTSFMVSEQKGTDPASARTHVVTEIADVENGLIIFRHQYDCPIGTQPASMTGRSGTTGKYENQNHDD